MKLLKHQIAFLSAVILFTAPLLAQDSIPTMMVPSVSSSKSFTGTKGFRTWSIGINAGVLAPVVVTGGSNDFTKWKPSFGYGAYIKNQFTHWIGVQAEFLKGTLEGNNENALGNGAPSPNPFASFKTDLNWTGSISAIVSLGSINFLQKLNTVLPYVSVGGGLAAYTPTLMSNSGEKIEYKPDGSIKEFFIPVGMGLKFNVSSGVNIDLGYRMNFVDADNLDGYSRGMHKDKFSYGHAGVEILLGNKTKPQLAFHNPAAQLMTDMQEENNALRTSVAASEQRMQEKLAQVDALKNDVDKLKNDADKDGVSDYFDKCPGTTDSVKVDGAGCPLPMAKPEVIREQKVVITEEDRRIVREAIRNLEFETGKSTIRDRSFASLDRVADILVKKNFSLKLAGHTDNVGTSSSNMKLSKNRAEAVKEYLVAKGANPSRIEATGYGEEQPISSNKTAAGRQKNRRVEFTLY